MKVLDFPLTKITLWFLIGILFCYYSKPSIYFAIPALVVGLVLFILSYFTIRKNKNINTVFGISTYFISFFIGVLTLLFHTNSLQESNYIHCEKAFKSPQIITFTLREKLKSNSYNDRFTAIVNTIGDKPYSGKIIVNIRKDSLKNPIIGNLIKVKTVLQRNESNKNPNQFDYSQYLANKQVYAQVYLTKAELNINKKIKKDIWYYSGRLHARIVRNLDKANFNKEEMNVALALILGQQQDISTEIIQDYQYSGATHVLSVSGLHVGFIMIFINFILKPIPNTRKGSLIKLFSILLSLTTFAIISGLSPSVLRSVVMFSFLSIGNHLRRTGSIYHTLLVSILLILLFEPYFLFDVGFQLSYLALLFIVWLQPVLKKIWKPKNKIQTSIWNALTVSFAAQIGTLPLCLYYFHQFPGLFFVTNIVIIPLLSFIMIAGIIVMLFAIVSSPPVFLIVIFEKSIYLLNLTIHIVASFEWFIIRDISFNSYYLLTFYLFIISAIVWTKKPDYNKLCFLLTTIILLQVSFLCTKKEIESIQEFIVYNTKKNTLISERNGRDIILYTKDSISKNNVLNFYLVGNSGRLKATNSIKNILFFKNKKIFLIDSSGVYTKNIQPDILILTQSTKINLERILRDLHPKIIIADASNSHAILKAWKLTCLKKNIPFHATNEKGYYKLN
jgi:competence protein ComEC